MGNKSQTFCPEPFGLLRPAWMICWAFLKPPTHSQGKTLIIFLDNFLLCIYFIMKLQKLHLLDFIDFFFFLTFALPIFLILINHIFYYFKYISPFSLSSSWSYLMLLCWTASSNLTNDHPSLSSAAKRLSL